ncbi:MAG: hypothetical protein ACE5J6_00195 [Candidatus Bathyarchaeia archaeon]
MQIVFWEHLHAYQPRRILDGFTGEERFSEEGFLKRVRDREVSGKNLFEVVLIPGSVYDEIIESAVNRSINVEPVTLEALKRLNQPAYERLVNNVLNGKISIVATAYCHPILPMMLDNSEFDVRVNLAWSLWYFYREFWHRLKSAERTPPIAFWFPECGFNKKTATILFQVIDELAILWGWQIEDKKFHFILDEAQGIDVDPSRVYSLKLDGSRCFVFYRYHQLSGSIAFDNNLKTIMTTFWRELRRCKFGLIGVANDAECYGGNYNPDKPTMIEKMRERIGRVWIIRPRKEKSRIQTMTTAAYLETLKDMVQESEAKEYSAWSDYTEGSQFHYSEQPRAYFEYYVGQRSGGLCRWTGLEREPDGTLSNRAYFLVLPRKEPDSEEVHVRVVSSLWKAAFNKLRDDAANFVRSHVFTIVQRYLIEGRKIDELLTQYWTCALQRESIDDFITRMAHEGLLHPPQRKEEHEDLKMALQAYQWACQDAYISCPTFWQFFENELTWTSLAHSAASFAKIATMFYTLGEHRKVEEVAEEYRQLFLEFGINQRWREYVHSLDAQLPLLFEAMKEAAKQGGYDVSAHLAEQKGSEKSQDELWLWAQETCNRLYGAAMKNLGTVRPGDKNPHLILAKLYDSLRQKERAEEEWDKAKWYEWEKCIQPHYSDKNIVQRVGFLHAKHFPEYQRFLEISEKDTMVDVRTI